MPHRRRKTSCAYRVTLAGILSGPKGKALQKKLKQLGFELSYGKSDPRQGRIVQTWGRCLFDIPPNANEDFNEKVSFLEQQFEGCRVAISQSAEITLVVAE